jgi:hypothetical protein
MQDLYTSGDGTEAIIADYPGVRLAIYKKHFNHLPWPLWQMVVLKKIRILYNPIAKCGSSFLRQAMVALSGMPESITQLPLDTYCTGLQLGDLPREEAQAILHDPSFLRIAVIRDPFGRLVSAYLDKFVLNRMDVGNRFHTTAVIAEIRGRAQPTEADFHRSISFAEFVEYLVTQPPEKLDPHWCPQVLYLKSARFQLFRLDRLEALDQTLIARGAAPVQGDRRNVTRQTAIEVPDAHRRAPDSLPHADIATSSFYDELLRRKVEAYYALDLTLINTLAPPPGVSFSPDIPSRESMFEADGRRRSLEKI